MHRFVILDYFLLPKVYLEYSSKQIYKPQLQQLINMQQGSFQALSAMAQKPKIKKQQGQEDRNEQEQEQKDKRKVKLIKKRRIPASMMLARINLKHIVNINDTWFINEETLRNPEGSQQNIQRAMFRYKMISKIVLNSSFVGLQLKKVDDNYLPPQYFFERFRSLGDSQIASIANQLQSIYVQNLQKQEKAKQDQIVSSNIQQIQLLNQFLQKMDGKMYTIYFVEAYKCRVNLKNIFFSVPLLQVLGWNIKRVATQFLKYKHVFFQIFSPRYYKNYIQLCLNSYRKAQQLEKDETLTKQQKIQMTTIYFDDQVVRQVDTQHGIYEEFLKAKVKFSCPHPSLCCVEILQIDERPSQGTRKKKKINLGLTEMTSPEEQIFQLKKLGFESSFLQLSSQYNSKERKDKTQHKQQ